MAMSSLQAQLASLHSQGSKNPGSSFATSKRHEDAVGRGVGHSVQHGHALSTRDPKFKPSILHADAKAASDVPLTTLRENAVASLEQLVHLTRNDQFFKYKESLFGVHSLHLERGLSTKADNEQRHQTIGELLMLLGTAFAEINAATSCLHVMEYLVRRFDIHLTCVDMLLVSMLAHHEQPVFSRLLQLIDLANHPTWCFLRPFAAPNAPSVSRQIIAKRASKAHLIMKHACDIAKHAAKIHVSEAKYDIRRGISHCISFGAAVVVEGFTLQATASGTVQEATLRTVLPYCLNACGNDKIGFKNEDWRGFGYIVASCIAEHSVLTPEAADTLASTIVEGVAIYDEDDELERVVDGLETLIAVLSSYSYAESDTILSIVGLKTAQFTGYHLAPKTFKSLTQLPLLVEAIGMLHEQRGVIVAPLIASVAVAALQNANTTKLISRLIQNPATLSIWNDPQYNLVTSFTYHLVQKTTKTRQDETDMESAKSILAALRVVDANAYDLGISHAVTQKIRSKTTRARLASLLDVSFHENACTDTALLPPRLALEHADATVRLAAIPRLSPGDGVEMALLRHFTIEDNMDIVLASGRAVKIMLENTLELTSIAPAILAALQHWAIFHGISDKSSNIRTAVNGLQQDIPKERFEILDIAFSLASQAVKALVASGSDDNTMTFLIQGIAAHLDFAHSDDNTTSENELASRAAAVLCYAFQKTKGDSMLMVKDLFVAEEKMIVAVSRSHISSSNTGISLSRRYQLVFVDIVSERLLSKSKGNKEIAEVGLRCCLSFLESEHEVTKRDCIRLLACIQGCVKFLSLAELFYALDSLMKTLSEKSFSRVARGAIVSICAIVKMKTSPVSLLMEIAAREKCPVVALKRVLLTVTDLVTSFPDESNFAIGPTLALLAHTDQGIRATATALLSSLEPLLTNRDAKVFASVGNILSSERTSIQLSGVSALPNFFRRAIEDSENPELARAFLLECCVTLLSDKALTKLGAMPGAFRSCSIILSAIEFAGESVFPLTERWSLAGSKITNILRVITVDNLYPEEYSTALLQTIGRMLKGAIVVDSSSLDMDIIISTGPSSRGSRARSYSVGRSSGVALLCPYPTEMVTTLINCFKQGSSANSSPMVQSMCNIFLHDVVGRQSWSEGIFMTLSVSNRTELAFAVIALRASGSIGMDTSPFLNLSLEIEDVCSLIQKCVKDSLNLTALTFTMDYIRTNSIRLAEHKNATRLISSLFDTVGTHLITLSADSDDDLEFASHSVLLALEQVIKNEKSVGSIVPKSRVSSFTTTLMKLLGCVDIGGNDENLPLKTWRAKITALDLLASLCRCRPKSVVPMLIHAVINSTITNRIAEFSETTTEYVLRTTRDTFIAMVPVIVDFASGSGCSIFNLFSSFFAEMNSVKDIQSKNYLFKSFVDALLLKSSSTRECHLGLFLSCLFANEIAQTKSNSSLPHPRQLLISLLQGAPIRAQVESLKEFVAIANAAVSNYLGDEVETHRKASLQSVLTMYTMKQSPTMESTVMLANNLSRLVLDILGHPFVEQFVKRGTDTDAALSLEIWQGLLLLQASAMGLERASTESNNVKSEKITDVSKALVVSLRTAIDASLSALQNMLPAHIFLASASCLIENDSSAELQSKALRFVAERASVVEVDSPEASLFLDFVPSLVSRLVTFENDTTMDGFVVRQAIVVAIEQIARTLILFDVDSKNSLVFFSALKSISRQLEDFAVTFIVLENDAMCQLVCSMVLSVVTLVQTLKARCLPVLPKLIFSLLKFINEGNHAIADKHSMKRKQAELTQLPLIRLVITMVECVPQFLIPYLDHLLSPAILASPSLKRCDNDDIVLVSMVETLDLTLAKSIPCRQLVPAACKALSTCKHADTLITILTIMKNSIDQAPKADLPTVRNYVVKAMLMSFDFEGSIGESFTLLDTANGVGVALIMKLSEVQLRALFTKVREWRDEKLVDVRDAARRQHAFWSMAAVLSKELRSIFFSCMSDVFEDAVKELETVVSALGPKIVKVAGGTKKQKLETITQDTQMLRYLEPLLLCLEYTLKADAHEGGQWIRADESSRYHFLLNPLTKLLQINVPSNFPLPESKMSPYQQLVMTSESGNVIRCITALASAAGNEQLWKPLNHGVLEACSNQDRSEVRKAGVTCLLSLIKALGEEYMVLLPECLPILSELLEDSDEETAGLAQECVSLSEELLGESLQDSLR